MERKELTEERTNVGVLHRAASHESVPSFCFRLRGFPLTSIFSERTCRRSAAPSASVRVRPAFTLWHVGVGRGRRSETACRRRREISLRGRKNKGHCKSCSASCFVAWKEGRKVERADTRSLSQVLQRRVELELFFPRGTFFPSLSRFGHPRRQKR